MLIQPARIKGIPWIKFSYDPQVNKPVVLKQLMYGLRRMGRNLPADSCHIQKFHFPFTIPFFSASISSSAEWRWAYIMIASHAISIAFSSSSLSYAVTSLTKSKLINRFFYLLLQLSKTCSEHFISKYSMTRCPLFLKFGEQACL